MFMVVQMNGNRRVLPRIAFMCVRVVASAVQPAAAVFNKTMPMGCEDDDKKTEHSAGVRGSVPQEGPKTHLIGVFCPSFS